MLLDSISLLPAPPPALACVILALLARMPFNWQSDGLHCLHDLLPCWIWLMHIDHDARLHNLPRRHILDSRHADCLHNAHQHLRLWHVHGRDLQRNDDYNMRGLLCGHVFTICGYPDRVCIVHHIVPCWHQPDGYMHSINHSQLHDMRCGHICTQCRHADQLRGLHEHVYCWQLSERHLRSLHNSHLCQLRCWHLCCLRWWSNCLRFMHHVLCCWTVSHRWLHDHQHWHVCILPDRSLLDSRLANSLHFMHGIMCSWQLHHWHMHIHNEPSLCWVWCWHVLCVERATNCLHQLHCQLLSGAVYLATFSRGFLD